MQRNPKQCNTIQMHHMRKHVPNTRMHAFECIYDMYIHVYPPPFPQGTQCCGHKVLDVPAPMLRRGSWDADCGLLRDPPWLVHTCVTFGVTCVTFFLTVFSNLSETYFFRCWRPKPSQNGGQNRPKSMKKWCRQASRKTPLILTTFFCFFCFL